MYKKRIAQPGRTTWLDDGREVAGSKPSPATIGSSVILTTTGVTFHTADAVFGCVVRATTHGTPFSYRACISSTAVLRFVVLTTAPVALDATDAVFGCVVRAATHLASHRLSPELGNQKDHRTRQYDIKIVLSNSAPLHWSDRFRTINWVEVVRELGVLSFV